VSLPELVGSWTPSESMVTVLAGLRTLIATGGPLPEDQELGLDSSGGAPRDGVYGAGIELSLDLFPGTIYPCRVGPENSWLGLTDAWALQLVAHRTRWVGGPGGGQTSVPCRAVPCLCVPSIHPPTACGAWRTPLFFTALRLNWVSVAKAQELLQIQKLKFKRGLSLTIVFKGRSGLAVLRERAGCYLDQAARHDWLCLQTGRCGRWRQRRPMSAWRRSRRL
jgi:hypothetical protein